MLLIVLESIGYIEILKEFISIPKQTKRFHFQSLNSKSGYLCHDTYNRGKSTLAPVFFEIQPVLGQAVDIAGSLVMNEKLFVQKYKNTVIHRLGLIRFLRNCLIAAGNIRDLSFLPLIVNYIKHCDPLLRAHAVWSFSQYNTKDVRDILEKHQKIEKSALVIEEISFALQAID